MGRVYSVATVEVFIFVVVVSVSVSDVVVVAIVVVESVCLSLNVIALGATFEPYQTTFIRLGVIWICYVRVLMYVCLSICFSVCRSVFPLWRS